MASKQTEKAIAVKEPKKTLAVADSNKIYRLIAEIDRPLLIVVIALVCIGSVMVFSASYAIADTLYDDSYFFARSQIQWVFIGMVVMLLLSRVPIALYKPFAYIFYVIVLALNFAVPYAGITKHGATRWFSILGMEFQPSELLKFALILALATYISNNAARMRSFRYGLMPIALLTAPACLATLLQRHMSATIILFLLGVVMLWISGTKRFYFGIVLGIGVVFIIVALTIGIPLLEQYMPHVLTRLKIWEDPFAYMSYESGGEGWQPAQSLYAISSGGFWGLGLGQSNQKHGYLPEPQNDYIFAILCEELGFFGVMCVIALFGVLAYRGFKIAEKSTSRFSALMSMGITSQIIVQTLLNFGVVTNTLPSTGISLPFFSYGGTSLTILLAEMGIVLSISRFSCVEQG